MEDYKLRTQNMYNLLYAGQIAVDTKEQFLNQKHKSLNKDFTV